MFLVAKTIDRPSSIASSIMGRSPCCDENGLKKGPWTPEEDQKLIDYIQKHGHGSWRALPKLAGLNRRGKSCRLRWTNYLRPDIKRGKFSPEEEQTIFNLHSIIGNKWSAIATHLPGRTDNEIKNFWNTHLKKKLIQMGLDPMTHRPRTDFFAALPGLLALANLRDLVDARPWDDHSLHLHAEAAKCLQYLLHPANCPTDVTHHDLDSMGQYNPNPSACSFGSIPDSIDILPGFAGLPLSSSLEYSLPPLADISAAGNAFGDACSTSSGSAGISSFWPDLLLEDPFATEFA